MSRTYDDATRVGPKQFGTGADWPCADGEIQHPLGGVEVLTYRGNHSAFNGYQFTPSDYSSVRCTACGGVWRTKAAWVDKLPRRGTLAQQHATYDRMIDERIERRSS